MILARILARILRARLLRSGLARHLARILARILRARILRSGLARQRPATEDRRVDLGREWIMQFKERRKPKPLKTSG